MFGFAAVECSQFLPEGINGVIINRNTLGIASRYNAPMANAYPATWKTVDPDSGFVLGGRMGCDLGSGKRYIAMDALVGAQLFYGGRKAVRLYNS